MTTATATPVFKIPQEAFEDAIAAGRLSANPNAANYAGRYMYMGTYGGPGEVKDQFKHIATRQYLN